MKHLRPQRSALRRSAAIAASAGIAASLLIAPVADAIDAPDATVFVSEIHYDNAGADVGEAIEVFGPAGQVLDGWSLVLYNGSNGAVYSDNALSGAIPDLGGGVGVVTVEIAGIQNGSPDGIALVDDADSVVQFISYEGSLTAVGGPANGLVSVDIGVAESGTTPLGQSLQLVGSGTTRGDFTWAGPQEASFGALNDALVGDVGITEFHYDNAGADEGEGVEVSGSAGTDLSGWTIVAYNGSNGAVYDTEALSGVIPDEADGFGAVSFPIAGLQNGSPDGLALVAPDGTVVEFLSYEGSFVAIGGAADGLMSVDVGVSEPGSTPVGQSLQLVDGVWIGPADNSFGLLNDVSVGDVGITEFHYDNAGADEGEGVEVSGSAGTDLSGWTIVAYNGSNGAVYDTEALSGVIPDEADGFGAVSFPIAGLQNGSPDGLALVAPDGTVVEFLSYEGSFVAIGGAADGLMSVDVGVSETGSTPVGQSLQLVDGVWIGPADNSFGLLNGGDIVDPPTGSCAAVPAVSLISEVQGAGAESPCDGDEVVFEGVVVADYEGDQPELRGLYVQEEDADVDADPLTSEGVFVFTFGADTASLGDVVRVTGTVDEFQGQTQIGFATVEVIVPGDGLTTPGVSATPVTLPLASADALEAVEGMLVTFPQELTVTEYFQLGRFGQVVVSSGGRLDNPTAVAEPGPDAQAVQAANDLNRLIIDDTTNDQNPEPIIFGGNGQPLAADNPLRGGDVTTGATGVMTFTWAGNAASGNAYRLRPATGPIEFTTANPRPDSPPEVGGTLTAASFNVLNYFLTIDETIDGNRENCGPVGSKDDCRGADSALELERQRTKLLAALVSIDADVIGLVELENTELADGTPVEPLADIVAGLNEIDGDGTWGFVQTGAIGTDVIKVGIVYRTAAVSELGDFAVLDASVDPRFDDTRNRPALAATFVQNGTGEVMTVVVNHFKSKGCRDSSGANADQGDGQGCWNESRTLAAEALVDWLATSPTGIDDDDVLVLGDLNAYANEDPIDVFADAGYVDLAPVYDDNPYSFVFDGQWGYLDYALASPTLVAQVTGAAEYHINADEVPVLDYNTDFQSDTQIDDLYAPDRFRTSDHDPVLVGLGLNAAPGGRTFVFPSVLWPTNGRLRNVFAFGITERWRFADVEIIGVTSSEADSGLSWRDRPGDIVFVNDTRVKLRAEAFDRAGRRYSVSVATQGDGQVRIDTHSVYVFPRRSFW